MNSPEKHMGSKKIQSTKISRRRFLKTTGAAAGMMLSAPWYIPSRILGSLSPSNRITIGCIGVGNQGMQDLRGFLELDNVQALAVCDVNRAGFYKAATRYAGREPAQKMVNDYYASRSRSGAYRGCETYRDFRELLARGDIDAVLIVTPDHWHAVMAIEAARVGKDIYCEKPLGYSVRESRAMVEAVRRYGRVLQTGTHHRSDSVVRYGCELIRNGYLGKLTKIHTCLPAHSLRTMVSNGVSEEIPDDFDYDMWLGPAPWAPYHERRCFYTFRFIQDYAGGETTNTGAHIFDIIQWALGRDRTTPVEFEDMGSKFPSEGLYDAVSSIRFRARYSDGLEIVCLPEGHKDLVARFEGTEGFLEIYWHHLKAHSDSLLRRSIAPGETRLYHSSNHYYDFVQAVRSRRDPIAPVEVGHASATFANLANIAMRLHRKIVWDPTGETFGSDEEANRMLSRSMRSPWRLPV